MAYGSIKSLACLIMGVEVLSALISAPRGLADAASSDEPDPAPDAQIFQNSSYFEGKQLLAKHHWVEAAVVLRSVLRKTPEFSPAAVGLASALAYSGRREEALSVLSQVLAREKGREHQALITRTRVVSKIFLTKEDFQTYQDGLSLLVSRKYRPAREKLEKALSQEPDNVEILTRLGQCLTLEGDYDSAAERLRLAKKLNPYEPEVRLWLGRALHQRGELSDAVDELHLAYSDLSGDETAAIWLADAMVSLGQEPAAIQILESDVKQEPFHLQSLLMIAKIRGETAGSDSRALSGAQKDLKIALSRLDEYKEPKWRDLGLDIRPTSSEIKEDIRKLMSQIESRQSENSSSGV